MITGSEGELLLEILHLKRQGLSLRSIGRELGVGRKKVTHALKRHEEQRAQGNDPLPGPRQSRRGKLDRWETFIGNLLEKYPKITAVRVHEELQAEGYEGGYTMVRERVRQLRPKPKVVPVIRFETAPGVQGQMDWSEYTLHFRQTGAQRVWCFSYILGFSRRQYIDFTTNRRFPTMIRRHRDAFTYFGGVPRECLYDGEKTVISRWEAGRPVFNPAFLAFITHYGCKPIGCLPGRPQTKGKVEKPFQSVEGNLLNGRDFEDLDNLRRVARWWLEHRSDTHPHRTTKQSPLDRFMEKEKDALLPLPYRPYDTSEIKYVVGRDDGYIEFETNLYAVPYDFILCILIVKADEHEIRVYTRDVVEIARHPRFPAGACQKREDPAYHESARRRHGLEPVRAQFLELGCYAETFLGGLRQNGRQVGAQVRRILKLLEVYEPPSINLAFKRAIRYHAYDASAIENILKARFRPRHLESWHKKKPQHKIPSIEQRPLGDYPFLKDEDDP